MSGKSVSTTSFHRITMLLDRGYSDWPNIRQENKLALGRIYLHHSWNVCTPRHKECSQAKVWSGPTWSTKFSVCRAAQVSLRQVRRWTCAQSSLSLRHTGCQTCLYIEVNLIGLSDFLVHWSSLNKRVRPSCPVDFSYNINSINLCNTFVGVSSNGKLFQTNKD